MSRMTKFLNSIGIEDPEDFDLSFQFIHVSEGNKRVEMAICKRTPWDYAHLSRFIEALSNVKYGYSIRFSYDEEPNADKAYDLLSDWGMDHFHCLPEFFPAVTEIIVVEGSMERTDEFKKRAEELFKFINYPFGVSLASMQNPKKGESESSPSPFPPNAAEIESEQEGEEKENKDEDPEPLPPEEDYEALKKEAADRYINEARDSILRQKMWERGHYKKVESIGDLYSMGICNVEVEGEAFGNIEARTSNKGKLYTRFAIGDDTGAINVRVFEGRSIDGSLIEDIAAKSAKGKAIFPVRVYGALQEDRFDHIPAITVHKIELLDSKKLRDDPYPRKRVELHLHTNMSAMDGIPAIADYCALAKNMGMSAIGITDHGVLQNFPAAQSAGKKYGLKIVYGCEFYMIEDRQQMVLNPSPIQLRNAECVVFDTETTGLSSRYDRIIEIGAIKIKDGKEVGRFKQYYNPGMHIPESASRINHITDEMVASMPRIEDDLDRILEFFGSCVLVAHNATFDIGMLNATLLRDGREELTNPVIDTLPLSHYLFPKAGRHSEGAMLRSLGLGDIYNDTEAHEADYDAEKLYFGYREIVERLDKEHPGITHADLAHLSLPLPDPNDPDKARYEEQKATYNAYCSHIHDYHVTAWAKNKQGLSDLYRLVTAGHVDYFSKTPKTPKRLLEQYRENLIIGTACFNGEIMEVAKTKSFEELKEALRFYDVVEIQPLENYSYLLNINDFSSLDELKRTLNDIIEAAKSLGKTVIATGDAHYLNPDDKIVRDIYISTATPGTGRHPLNPNFRENLPEFENPDQHFRSTKEMIDSFSKWLPLDYCEQIVIDNPNAIADSVDVLEPVLDDLFKPDANLPHSDRILREMCEKNFEDRYGGNPDPEVQKRVAQVKERLEKELSGIIGNGYSVTYIIASRLIKMAHDEPEHYIVGSRGSVGSSFAATMADITEVNPLPPHYLCPHCHYFEWGDDKKYLSGFDLPDKKCPHCGTIMHGDGQNIPFETFLGFSADKVPDIDLNFEDESQKKAHNYTKTLLGENNVFRCGTIETVAEKTAFGYVKGYFEKQGKDCNDPIFKNYIAYLAARCQGVKRTTGQHPGGIIVVPKDHSVFDFTAVQYPANDVESDWLTTHYDFHSMHDELLKLDILGHVDPMAMRYYRDYTKVDIESIPMNDPKVLSLFVSPKALKLSDNFLGVETGASGLPEFGTPLGQRMLKTAKPTCFNDLLIISGLAHGTNVWSGNAEDLIKSGTTDLHGVIGCRDDIMTYLISKGVPSSMAFKIMESVRKGRGLSEEFESKMKECKVPDYYIESCKKIKYLFPRGHATAYVMMAVRVAYFKLYYPLEFYAVFFSVRCDSFDIRTMIEGIDSIKAQIQNLQLRSNDRSNPLSTKEEEILFSLKMALEMEQRGYHFSNIDLYKSDSKMFVVDHESKSLIPPFKVIGGLGDAAGRSVVEARSNGKRFLSKEDLLNRTKLNQTNLNELDALGVLKGLGEKNQASIFEFL